MRSPEARKKRDTRKYRFSGFTGLQIAFTLRARTILSAFEKFTVHGDHLAMSEKLTRLIV